MLNEKKRSRILLIENIINVADVDTVFRDIYIERAKELLSNTLNPDVYKDFIKEKNMLARIPNRISEAMEKMDWETVKKSECTNERSPQVDRKQSISV